MRYPFESYNHNAESSWLSHKNRGKELYERQQYAEALQEYQAALHPVREAPRQEQQIILSNIVACRLKLGDQAEEAVKEAKQCVALNPSWAKGHVRLASAYVALGGHSNDACNELQTALRLDPGNTLARQMLMRELRRDHAAARPDPPVNPNYVPPPEQHQEQETVLEVDDSVSFTERIQFLVARVSLWYERQSSETKQWLKIALVLVALYVAFGGRFGFEYASQQQRHGNYERGNLYDQYRQNYYHQQQTQYSPPSYHRRSGTTQQFGGATTGYASSYSEASSSLASMAMVLGAAYVCHRNGINPLHAMFMMNMMRGGGGRRRGYGGMMGGGGFRFGRPRW